MFMPVYDQTFYVAIVFGLLEGAAQSIGLFEVINC